MNPATVRQFAVEPAAFRESLVIPGARGPARFGDIMADFQRRDFAALDKALLALAAGRQPEIGRFWFERTKGASKDTDLAVSLLWLLTFCPSPLTCQVGAADADQADELRKAAKLILRLNSWLSEVMEIQAWSIINTRTDSRCEIIPADVAGSHGARPDVMVLNELSHVGKREFAENLLDNAAKVPHGVVVIATNAGFIPSWQWDWRENARTSARWYFSPFAQPAPWLDAAEIAEAQRRNSPSRFARLWKGVWVSGAGDALDEQAVQAACTLPGPLMAAEKGWLYVAGLDLGLKRDASALVVVGRNIGWREQIENKKAELDRMTSLLVEFGYAEDPLVPSYVDHPPTGRYKLALVRVWRPALGTVSVEAIEEAVLQAHRRFGLWRLAYDPWQAEYLAQRVRQKGIATLPVDAVPANLKEMAAGVMDCFAERLIDLYADSDLLHDLANLRIVEKQYGVRLESPRGPMGHGDAATGLSLALLPARRYRLSALINRELVYWPDKEERARFAASERESLRARLLDMDDDGPVWWKM